MNSLKKTLTLTTVVCLLGAGNALAVDFSINTTIDYESKYVFRGIQLADDSFQPSVEAAIDSAYFGIWANLPTDDPLGVAGTEIDFYGGYGFDLSEGVSLDVGATLYHYPETDPGLDDSTLEAYIGISLDVPLEPGLYIYWDFDLDTFTIEASGSYSFELADATSLDLSAYIGSVSPDAGDSYVYVGGSVDLSYAFTDNASGSFGVRISSNDLPGSRDSSFWVGITFSAGF